MFCIKNTYYMNNKIISIKECIDHQHGNDPNYLLNLLPIPYTTIEELARKKDCALAEVTQTV